MSLADNGVDVTIVARTQDPLEDTAEEIRKATGVRVTPVAVDITSEEGRDVALAACGTPDLSPAKTCCSTAAPVPAPFRNQNRITAFCCGQARVLGVMKWVRRPSPGAASGQVSMSNSITARPLEG